MKNLIKYVIKFFFLAMLLLPSLFVLLVPRNQKRSMFAAWSQLLSVAPGKTGSYIRNAFYYHSMKKNNFDGTIHFGTIFSDPDIVIGKNVYIN